MTASYCARLASVNALPSSVAVTPKWLAAPRPWIAVMPSSMFSWWKAAVLEKTSTLNSSWLGLRLPSWSVSTAAGRRRSAARRSCRSRTAGPWRRPWPRPSPRRWSGRGGRRRGGRDRRRCRCGRRGRREREARVAPSGRATIVAKDVPSARRADFLNRVMNGFITNSFVDEGLRSLWSRGGSPAVRPLSCWSSCCAGPPRGGGPVAGRLVASCEARHPGVGARHKLVGSDGKSNGSNTISTHWTHFVQQSRNSRQY